jgi:hypothetical protein
MRFPPGTAGTLEPGVEEGTLITSSRGVKGVDGSTIGVVMKSAPASVNFDLRVNVSGAVLLTGIIAGVLRVMTESPIPVPELVAITAIPLGRNVTGLGLAVPPVSHLKTCPGAGRGGSADLGSSGGGGAPKLRKDDGSRGSTSEPGPRGIMIVVTPQTPLGAPPQPLIVEVYRTLLI